MSYTPITQSQYKQLQGVVTQVQFLPMVDLQICNYKKMEGYFFEKAWNEISMPTEDEIWTLAPHAPHEIAEVDFKETTDYLYRTGKVLRIPRAHIEASKNNGTPLDTATLEQLTRLLSIYRARFCFQGPLLKNGSSRLTTAGLFNKAGNTSTYTTVKFASASGPYNAVKDMKGKLLDDGFGTGPLDLIVDSTLAPYLWSLPATDANFSEGQRIKEQLLNGGDIHVAATYNASTSPYGVLPAASSNDGVMLLVENNPLYYEIESPNLIELIDRWVYNVEYDTMDARVDLALMMHVKQPNAICKHVTVDLA